ncbi:MAG: alpha/beta hydrolase [Sphingomonadales bacterium]|nr:alpha/beta hydrolase [Sphingomonadales bacterium]
MTDIAEFALQRVALATGVELDVVDTGPRDAPALIFLHGFPESHRTWREQIPEFAHDFRVIAPDQRGYCKSSKPEGVDNYAPERIAGDVFALADALGIDRFTVIGHDWGGAIAWMVALIGGPKDRGGNGRVEHLVILNAPHPYLFQKAVIDDADQRAASQYIRDFRDPANDALIAEHGLVGLLMKAVRWERSTALSFEESAIMLRNWQEPGAAMAMINWYRATPLVVPAIGEDAARPAMLDAPFPPIAVPTLVIWATDDLALRPCLIEGLDEYVADLTLVKVPGCGHFVPWEAPQAVNTALRGWLDKTA